MLLKDMKVKINVENSPELEELLAITTSISEQIKKFDTELANLKTLFNQMAEALVKISVKATTKSKAA